ncbi:hypothetical protein MKW94_017400, partial [Papaver nudicaule]|nr:hypothetical protein [Papaver nudicaule]
MAEGSVCEICMEAKPGNEMRNTSNNCSHTYCSKCITEHISAKLQENFTMITCPELNCKQVFERHMCRDIIPLQVFDRWETALKESLVLPSDKVEHDMLLIQLAEKNKWRQCPGCKYYVERLTGCLHITC